MRWDIDKALKDLGGDPIISKATLTVDGGPRQIWVLKLNKHLFHGRSIHETYLNARKGLKKLPPEVLAAEGLKKPRKRSNSYASARRKKRAQAKA